MSNGYLQGSVNYDSTQSDIQSNFGTNEPGGFCLPCFLRGLLEGGLFALGAIAVAALAPEAAILIAAYGIYSLIELAKNWSSMTDAQKSEAAGMLVGGLAVGGLAASGEGAVGPGEGTAGARSGPVGEINPADVAGKTPQEIHDYALDQGLQPKGPDPQNGKGAYVDPETNTQRILSHPNADPPHAHVNNPAGERLDINGNVVPPESPDAHLPINTEEN